MKIKDYKGRLWVSKDGQNYRYGKFIIKIENLRQYAIPKAAVAFKIDQKVKQFEEVYDIETGKKHETDK